MSSAFVPFVGLGDEVQDYGLKDIDEIVAEIEAGDLPEGCGAEGYDPDMEQVDAAMFTYEEVCDFIDSEIQRYPGLLDDLMENVELDMKNLFNGKVDEREGVPRPESPFFTVHPPWQEEGQEDSGDSPE